VSAAASKLSAAGRWFVGGRCHDVAVATSALRRIVDPVIAAPPAGVRVRTRLKVTAAEAATLTTIGLFLGSVYRSELAGRIRCGVLGPDGQRAWRAERKRAITAVSSSRWAGAITRTVEDQYQLGMRSLTAQVTNLRAAISVLEPRCALRPGELAPVDHDDAGTKRPSRRQRGYRNKAERFVKTRRLAALRERLVTAERTLAAGCPSITVGGKRFWRNRNNLDAAELSEQQWRQQWDSCRMFFTADGEAGRTGGNETIRVDGDGHLRIKTPSDLVGELGSHVVIAAPVRFSFRGEEWAARVAARQAVRYDLSYDSIRGRWYIDASWTITPEPMCELAELRTTRVLGVDLNVDDLACCILDASGNPIGRPTNIELPTVEMSASRRDGRVRAAITALLDHAQVAGCGAVVVENLGFADDNQERLACRQVGAWRRQLVKLLSV